MLNEFSNVSHVYEFAYCLISRRLCITAVHEIRAAFIAVPVANCIVAAAFDIFTAGRAVVVSQFAPCSRSLFDPDHQFNA